jgi:uroporphyrin-III C-methyltransferase
VRVGTVYLVGAGPGDPGLLTIRGRDVIRAADVIVYDRLVNPALLDEARPDALRVFAGKAGGWHSAPQAWINGVLVRHARLGRDVVRLKGGDPFVFGRGGEEAEALAEAAIPFEVVPGVSAAIAAPAYAGIPITHRRYGSSVAIVTGHEDATKGRSAVRWSELATAVDAIVVLMAAKSWPRIVGELLAHGRSPDTPVALIRWGTTEAQQVVTGRLSEIAHDAEARALAAPIVLVIGEVVGLRDPLRWFAGHGDAVAERSVPAGR